MNVTELARRLKIPTSELKELLPRLGFDIGKKAIKVDDKSAYMIIDKIRDNPNIVGDFRKENMPESEEIIEGITPDSPEIEIPSIITVRDFAGLLEKPVASIIQELMKNGILANLNEQIDYETANIIAQDFGFVTKVKNETQDSKHNDENIEEMISKGSKKFQERPPIVVVMGHVDHGKTQLLDTIRKSDVVAKESGGITQHIGAYQVIVPQNKKQSSRPRASEKRIPHQAQDDRANRTITFIDTPGHEAFTAMRSRGARVADIAILIIAADDGIKPQTEEVIKIIDNAKLPFIVAINKIDKPEADVEKVKNQLAQKNLLPEDWGGKIITVPVSAKTGEGVDDLLEHLLLLADVEKEHIQADPNQAAIGTIIESHIDKGEGPVATVIIQSGTLKKNDPVQVGQVVGRIKFMKDYTGKIINEAWPSTPAKILGLKNIPAVGDILQTLKSGASLKQMMKKINSQKKIYQGKQNWQQIKNGGKKDEDEKIINIILKADVYGSVEAILQSLEILQHDDIKIKVIKKGLGNINDNDVSQAEKSNALLIGFNVKAENLAKEISLEKNISINLYTIIYDIIEHVKSEVEKLVEFETEIVEIGKAKILALFRSEKKNKIIGCLITKDKAELNAKVRIIRDKKKIGEGEITMLQQNKQEVKEIAAGTECGLQIKTPIELTKGDSLEIYKEEIVNKKINAVT
ncbi:MAG: translation initiation factor IF-2 [bacterium]|nr:translation initiation factor IF-2 [bacterium]